MSNLASLFLACHNTMADLQVHNMSQYACSNFFERFVKMCKDKEWGLVIYPLGALVKGFNMVKIAKIDNLCAHTYCEILDLDLFSLFSLYNEVLL